jgi:hypothetical protein
VKTVSIDTKLLSGNPARLSLAMPSETVSLRRTVTRTNIASNQAPAGGAGSSTTDNPVTVWVGEVLGARRATSSAVLIIAESGGVYGRITYFDRKTRTERTFTVRPALAVQLQISLSGPAGGPCMGQTAPAWQ